MLVATVGVLIWFGPSVVNVGIIVVAICNVVVFASQHRRAQLRMAESHESTPRAAP
jgi:hypothetical protein